jgi:hypothetical protein
LGEKRPGSEEDRTLGSTEKKIKTLCRNVDWLKRD